MEQASPVPVLESLPDPRRWDVKIQRLYFLADDEHIPQEKGYA